MKSVGWKRAVTGYFDYIEDLIERENTFNMEQFAASVKRVLDLPQISDIAG